MSHDSSRRDFCPLRAWNGSPDEHASGRSERARSPQRPHKIDTPPTACFRPGKGAPGGQTS
eukprot:7023261-Pyramimonas_sp.AAC.1